MTSHRSRKPTVLAISKLVLYGLLSAGIAGCDNQRAETPSAPAAQPAGPTAGSATRPTDPNAAVPMDDAAGEPATTWPAGGTPADAAPPSAAEPAPAAAAPNAPTSDAPAPAAGRRESVGGLSFELPAGWTLKPASGMRIGTVTDGEVEIALSSFAGDVGGKLANVNRWRGQVGLPQIAEADLDKETRTIDVNGKQVMIVDAVGPETRLLAASIPGDGKLYFARLMGPADQVDARKDAFEAIVKSVKVE